MIVYFPHIPKTGGQTLIQGFYKAFGFKKCIKVWHTDFGGDVKPANFVDLSAKEFEGISVVFGHLNMSQFLMNTYTRSEFEKGNVRILTSVRDPIERIISLYNYISLYKKHPKHKSVKSTSPIDFIMEQPANFSFHFLKPKVKSTLDDIYGIMDIFPIEKSIHQLTIFFARNYNIEIGHLEVKNKSINLTNGEKVICLDDIPRDALENLQKKHSIDLELYHRSFDNCQ